MGRRQSVRAAVVVVVELVMSPRGAALP
jgi:hypothetical protein